MIDTIKNFFALATKGPNHTLMAAILSDNIDMMNVALRFGADVNGGVNRANNPLVEAIGRKNIEMVDILLRNGADPNNTKTEFLPLSVSIHRDNMLIFNSLIAHGADVNASDGEAILTAYSYGESREHFIKKLIELGAKNPNFIEKTQEFYDVNRELVGTISYKSPEFS